MSKNNKRNQRKGDRRSAKQKRIRASKKADDLEQKGDLDAITELKSDEQPSNKIWVFHPKIASSDWTWTPVATSEGMMYSVQGVDSKDRFKSDIYPLWDGRKVLRVDGPLLLIDTEQSSEVSYDKETILNNIVDLIESGYLKPDLMEILEHFKSFNCIQFTDDELEALLDSFGSSTIFKSLGVFGEPTVSELVLTEMRIPYVERDNLIHCQITVDTKLGRRSFEDAFRKTPAGAVIIGTLGPITFTLSEGPPVLTDNMKQSLVEEACAFTLPTAYNLNTGLNYASILSHAHNYLKTQGFVWHGVKKLLQKYIKSREYWEKVDQFHAEQTRLKDQRSKTAYRAWLNTSSNNFSEAEIEEAVSRYGTMQMTQLGHFWCLLLGISAGLFVMVGMHLESVLYWTTFSMLGTNHEEMVGGTVWSACVFLWLFHHILHWKNRRGLLWVAYVIPTDFAPFARVRYNNLFIQRTCTRERELPAVREGCTFRLPDNFHVPCKDKFVTVYGMLWDGCSVNLPMKCKHDLFSALRIRYTDASKPMGFASLRRKVIEHFKGYLTGLDLPPFVHKTRQEYYDHLPSHRRAKLKDAPQHLSERSYICSDFVKDESYPKNQIKPRKITVRSDEYQNTIGPFFYSVNCWMKELLRDELIYDGGRTAEQLGELVEEMDGLGYLYELDVSNWDGSIEKEWFELELWFLETFLPVDLPDWWPEVRKTWYLTVSHSRGFSYTLDHARRSGDMWTSCFNSMINLAIIHYVTKDMERLSIAKGDDNLVGCSKFIPVDEITRFYKDLGMKVEVKAANPDTASYCSGFFWKTFRGQRKWGINPLKILPRLGINIHNWHEKYHKNLLRGTLISLGPIGRHVPLIGELIAMAGRDGGPAIYPKNEAHKTRGEQWDLPSVTNYQQLSDMTGVSVYRIVQLEEEFGRMVIGDFPCRIYSRDLQIMFSVFFPKTEFKHDLLSIPKPTEPAKEPETSSINWDFETRFLVGPLVEELVCGTIGMPARLALIGLERAEPFNVFVHIGLQYLSASLGITFASVAHLFVNILIRYSQANIDVP